MIPDELLPRWRDLAALGWLATRRLGGPPAQLPYLGRIASAATWPITMTLLVGDQADRTIAALGRTALVVVRACEPAHLPWRRLLGSTAALPFAAAALFVPALATLGAAILADAVDLDWLCTTLVAAVLPVLAVTAVLMLSCVLPAVRSITPIQRRGARTLARRRGTPLAEASMLAADHRHRQAATELARRLLRHADAQQMAVIANPRNAEVATMYRRLGFEPLDPEPSRLLVRWCARRPSRQDRSSS